MPGQARRPARKTGLEAPFSANQKKAWVLQSSCTALFWGLAASFLASVPAEGLPANSGGPTAWLVAALTAHGVLVLVGATTWWWLSHHNPLEPGFRRLLPDSPRWSKQQYCAVHKAKIEGLDHHCTWLNVSVGRSNYVPFMLLTATGGAQFTVQFVVGALLLCDGGAGTFDGAAARARLGGDGPFAAWAAFLGLHAALAAFIGGCYLKLLRFHAMLARQGRGTYDWLLAQRQAARAKKPTATASAATPVAPTAAPAGVEMTGRTIAVVVTGQQASST